MAKEKSFIKEVGIFSAGIGAVLLFLAYVALTTIKSTEPDFLGMRRSFGIGLPVGLIGLLNLGSGIFILVQRSKVAIHAGMASGALVALGYFGFMLLATGTVGLNLTTIAIILVPIGLYSQGQKAIDEVGRIQRQAERDAKRADAE